MNDFLIFSKRLKLTEKINAYITENGINMDTLCMFANAKYKEEEK